MPKTLLYSFNKQNYQQTKEFVKEGIFTSISPKGENIPSRCPEKAPGIGTKTYPKPSKGEKSPLQNHVSTSHPDHRPLPLNVISLIDERHGSLELEK
jgi:hypothetical protein